MKYFIYFFSFLLVACSSHLPPTSSNLDLQGNNFYFFDVESQPHDKVVFYWASRNKDKPLKIGVLRLQHGQEMAKENYTWHFGDKNFKEIHLVLNGDSLSQYLDIPDLNQAQNLSLEVRFADNDQIIYQEVMTPHRVYMLSAKNIAQIKQRAFDYIEYLKSRYSDKTHVYQGYWDGLYFTDCGDKKRYYLELKSQAVSVSPSFMVIQAQKQSHYLDKIQSLNQAEIIWITKPSQPCVIAPE